MDGGVSLSELGFLACPVRERAISLRASSSVLAGPEPLGGLAVSEAELPGRILPINAHLLLVGVVGASLVSFDAKLSVDSRLERDAGVERRLYALDLVVPFKDAVVTPSKPRKRLDAGGRLSLRMMRRRRPGAG